MREPAVRILERIMNPYAHHPLIRLYQAECRQAADHHRLASAFRRTRWSTWFVPRARPRPDRPIPLRPAPTPMREPVDRAA